MSWIVTEKVAQHCCLQLRLQMLSSFFQFSNTITYCTYTVDTIEGWHWCLVMYCMPALQFHVLFFFFLGEYYSGQLVHARYIYFLMWCGNHPTNLTLPKYHTLYCTVAVPLFPFFHSISLTWQYCTVCLQYFVFLFIDFKSSDDHK